MLGKRTQDLAGKFEDFEFRDTYTMVQHLHLKKKVKVKSKPIELRSQVKRSAASFKNTSQMYYVDKLM
jgi:hypothetical protein